MALNWINPGREERETTAKFVQSEEAPEIRSIFPNPLPYDSDQSCFVPRQSASHMQIQASLQSLESALPAALGIKPPAQTTSKVWDALCDQVLTTQQDYNEHLQGPWRRLWYGIGNTSEVVGAWIEVIPSEYGLAVVKTGVAVIFKLAERSVAKRDKILKAFEEIQKSLLAAHPLKGSFRSHPDVSASLDDLCQAIVDSINDLIVLTSKETSARNEFKSWLSHRKTKKRDADSVLQLLADKTDAFTAAKDAARDQTIETIGKTTQYTALATTYVRREISTLDSHVASQTEQIQAVGSSVREYNAKLDKFGIMVEEAFARRDKTAEQHSAAASGQPAEEWEAKIMNKVLNVIMDAQKDFQIQLEEGTGRRARPAARRRRSAVVTEEQFCEAIADPADGDEPPDIEVFIALPDTDWNTIGLHRGDFSAQTQTQVQSLLQHGRFLDWMRGSYPDVLLVNGGLPHASMGSISAISVFCATLITSLVRLRPADAVVMHFFCGLHVDADGSCAGPTGLVRSLIMQAFVYLRRWGLLDLDFLDDRNRVRDLEDQDLDALCETLWSLLGQFEPGTQIYCIIDSATLFDTGDMLPDFEVVLDYLRRIVDDSKLAAVLKILMTSPVLSSVDIEHQPVFEGYPDSILTLSSEGIISGEMDEDGMEAHLSQVSSPVRSPEQKRTPTTARWRRYHDDYE